MSKPREGDNVVSDQSELTVKDAPNALPTDPSVQEKRGDTARHAATSSPAMPAKAEESIAETVAEAMMPKFDPLKPTILLEDGTMLEGAIGTADHEFRVTATNGRTYEHCAVHANGRWIYREVK